MREHSDAPNLRASECSRTASRPSEAYALALTPTRTLQSAVCNLQITVGTQREVWGCLTHYASRRVWITRKRLLAAKLSEDLGHHRVRSGWTRRPPRAFELFWL